MKRRVSISQLLMIAVEGLVLARLSHSPIDRNAVQRLVRRDRRSEGVCP
jgi:hypothetical protein